ncbi:MAG: hypothetical protein ABI681_13500, partial [Gemmatimonadales bacterium]
MKKAAAVAAIAFAGATAFAGEARAQVPADSLVVPADSVDSASIVTSPKEWSCTLPSNEVAVRRAGVAAVFIGGNAALYSYFKRAWWSGERADHFFFRA